MKAQRQTENEKWEEWLGGDGSDVSLQAKDQSDMPRCEATQHGLPFTIENQSQTGHLRDYCDLGISIKYSGGIMELRQRIRDTQAGYMEGKNRAAYIVKACNEYPKLVEALKAARSILAPIVHKMNVRDHFSEKNMLANVIDKAIANAEKSNG